MCNIDYQLQSRPVPHQYLVWAMPQIFDHVEEPLPGDIMLRYHHRKPTHIAVYADATVAIHAYPGRESVVKETAMRVLDAAYPLHSIWRLRAI